MNAREFKHRLESPRLLGLLRVSSSVGSAVRALRSDEEFRQLVHAASGSPALAEFAVNQVHQLAKHQPPAGYGHPNDLEMIAYLVCLADAESDRLTTALGMARNAVNAQWTAKVARSLSLAPPTTGTVTYTADSGGLTMATPVSGTTWRAAGARSESYPVAR